VRSKEIRYAVSLTVLLGVTACGAQGSSQDDAALAAATRFLATQSSDPDSACALLAPKTLDSVEQDGPCPDTLTRDLSARQDSSPTARSVEVYGKDAIARFEQDTVFLSLFRNGWRVTAAHCQPDGARRPFDCKVEGN
jgi:hypothetical protein